MTTAQRDRITVYGGGFLAGTPAFADESADGGEGEGHWVTINGARVYISGDGAILKGGERLGVKHLSELRAKGRAKEGTKESKAALSEVPHTRGEPDGDGSLAHPIAVGGDLERAARLTRRQACA